MSYRDDREALRQKNEDLERELQRARTELEKLRGRPSDALDVASSSASDRPPARAALGAQAALLGLAALVGLELGLLPLVAAAVAVLVALLAMDRLVVIAGPHEAIVLSGVARKRKDGTSVGYRVVCADRVVRQPVLESVGRLDLGLFTVDIVVPDAALGDGRHVEVELGACAKIDSEPAALERAVERFLGTEPEELAQTVRSAVLTATRQVLTSTSLARALDRLDGVTAAIRDETEQELARVGLTLFTLELYSIEERG